MAASRDYWYLVWTIVFTVYGQIVIKWRMKGMAELPPGLFRKLAVLIPLIWDPWIGSGFVAAFLASIAWMAALTRFELSHAYPFMSLNFVLVVVLSSWLLSEPLSLQRVLGIGLIVAGTVLAARS